MCPVGTRGERAASGRFAEGESEAEVASLTSTGHDSGLCVDQAGEDVGSREATRQYLSAMKVNPTRT